MSFREMCSQRTVESKEVSPHLLAEALVRFDYIRSRKNDEPSVRCTLAGPDLCPKGIQDTKTHIFLYAHSSRVQSRAWACCCRHVSSFRLNAG